MLNSPWKGKQQSLQGGTSPQPVDVVVLPSPMNEMICCPLLSLFLGLAEGGYFALNTRLVLKASGSATDLPCARAQHCTSIPPCKMQAVTSVSSLVTVQNHREGAELWGFIRCPHPKQTVEVLGLNGGNSSDFPLLESTRLVQSCAKGRE